MVLHGDDIVEVVATKRRGRIDNFSETPFHCRVQFQDEQQPAQQSFSDESEICLVACPHTDSGDGFMYPADPIM